MYLTSIEVFSSMWDHIGEKRPKKEAKDEWIWCDKPTTIVW